MLYVSCFTLHVNVDTFFSAVHTESVVTNELLRYLSEEIKSGKKPDAIKAVLLSEGWMEPDIQEALRRIQDSDKEPQISWLGPLTIRNFLLIALGLIIIFTFIRYIINGSGNVFFDLKNPLKNNTKPSANGTPTVIPSLLPTNFGKNIDCGTQKYMVDLSGKPNGNHPNLLCFITAAKICNPAVLTLVSEIDSSGVKMDSTARYAIAKHLNGCQLDINQGNITYTLPAGIPPDLLDPIISSLKKLENTKGTCVFANNEDLAAVFEKLNSGDFSMYLSANLQGQTKQTVMYTRGSCIGTYFEAIK